MQLLHATIACMCAAIIAGFPTYMSENIREAKVLQPITAFRTVT